MEIEADNAEAPLAVEADANQLQQALVNLALNARDAAARPESPDSGGAGVAPSFTSSADLFYRFSFTRRRKSPKPAPPSRRAYRPAITSYSKSRTTARA